MPKPFAYENLNRAMEEVVQRQHRVEQTEDSVRFLEDELSAIRCIVGFPDSESLAATVSNLVASIASLSRDNESLRQKLSDFSPYPPRTSLMPKYQFHCPNLHVQLLARRMDDRNAPATCPQCGEVANRIFSAAFNIIGDPVAYRPENKFALGFSETERKETMKADDKVYEKSWEGKTLPTKPTPTPSMNDIFHSLG